MTARIRGDAATRPEASVAMRQSAVLHQLDGGVHTIDRRRVIGNLASLGMCSNEIAECCRAN
jgi:hypothetical protein